VASPSTGFRRLVYIALAIAFALVLVGGVVRVSDSGLGCGPGGSGAEGWPLCGGRVIPLVDANMIVEYAHRLLAGSLAIVIAVLALLTWRSRTHPALQRASLAAFGLVIFQAALGGLTVEKGLKEELVAAHLGVAMVQLALLMLVAHLARTSSDTGLAPRSGGVWALGRRAPVQGSIRLLAVGASVAVLATIVAGGYMSANQLHGTDEPSLGVHTACGNDFPSCGGEFLPFGRSRALDIHLMHRALMYVASALVLSLFLAVLLQRRRGRAGSGYDPSLVRSTTALIGVLVLQILLGALNVWLGEHAWLVITHLAVGTLLWCSLVQVTLLALRAPQEAARVATREAEMEAAPA
jgi:cytochrome c oxidase assembly protein subunit 15